MEIPRLHNVFERRGVIERLEAWSEVQLNSERIAVEAGPEVDLVFNTRLPPRLPPAVQEVGSACEAWVRLSTNRTLNHLWPTPTTARATDYR